MKTIELTKEEQNLIDSFNRGEWKSVKNLDKEKVRYSEIAKNTLRKDKTISIRLSNQDLHKMKAWAMEEGIPYQTLISSLIHKHASKKKV